MDWFKRLPILATVLLGALAYDSAFFMWQKYFPPGLWLLCAVACVPLTLIGLVTLVQMAIVFWKSILFGELFLVRSPSSKDDIEESKELVGRVIFERRTFLAAAEKNYREYARCAATTSAKVNELKRLRKIRNQNQRELNRILRTAAYFGFSAPKDIPTALNNTQDSVRCGVS